MPLVTQIRSYELITPLFGGGVEPGVADPVTVIRGSEIRGQLRFWWRACRGGRFNGDLAAMKEAEDKLWGAASTERKPMPSQVEIVISIEQSGEGEHPFEVVAGSMDGRKGQPKPKLKANEIVAPAYAAFPLQPSEKEMRAGGIGMQTKTVRTKVRFTLKITYPEKRREEVEAALWAWETFGGIGARTRRGFGALKLVGVDGRPVTPPRAGEVQAKIREGLQKHVVSGTWPTGVPHLCLNLRMKVTGRHSDPKAAWEYLIKRLRDFRQSRYPGASRRQPGRSRWPEPDEIRRLTGRRCPRHAKLLSTVEKFPRAAFGLPIVFHFKDEKVGDPYDTTLQGRDYERLASSLILRPLACANGAVGLAMVLEGTGIMQLPGELILKDAPGDPTVQATLTLPEAKAISLLNGDPDVLQAFLKTL
ncbi:MAG: type III-B CRISPR module RAMP protein Cmr1 [Thermoanaerobacteraceae bacterium]|nr:type III-B CRISPR module RAMP protein Cmr1 [Thermoanaerobacteraceae bacterium]